MKSWTVQCGRAAYSAKTVIVEAETLDQAIKTAIEIANGDPDWEPLDECGATFIDAVGEGAKADPWQDVSSTIPVPDHFREGGEPALVTVTIVCGTVSHVAIENRKARVIIRDYDIEGVDFALLDTDGNGNRYRHSEWTEFTPPDGG